MEESRQVPYRASELPPARCVRVFAPHPDDEVFGPAGLLARYVAAGIPVHPVVLTDGAFNRGADASQYAEQRREESRRAATLLGLASPEFWNLPDRGLHYSEALIRRLQAAIEQIDADIVLAPALSEMHPDHRTLALATIEAVRRSAGKATLLMYEIGIPMPAPTTLIDISSVLDLKRRAMACFPSQLAQQRYADQVDGLNRFRTYTLGPEVLAAEAYQSWTPQADARPWAVLFENEYQRQRARGYPVSGDEAQPLVSILIRSMGRPTLARALDAVALQTYPNIEVVVVNASGQAHPPLPAHCGPHPLVFRDPVDSTGQRQPCHRAEAANLALDAATGKWLTFLDDDDWLAADHVEKLAGCLLRDPDVRAANTGVLCLDSNGLAVREFADPADPVAQMMGNCLPIHSVLFDRSLVQSGCRFDESLDLFEDWDFWLQIGEHTRFAFAPGVSAYYDLTGTSGVHQVPAITSANHAAIYAKWQSRWSVGGIQALIVRAENARVRALSTEIQLDQARQREAANEALLAEFKASENQLRQDLQVLGGEALARQSELQESRQNAEVLQAEIDAQREALAVLTHERDTLRTLGENQDRRVEGQTRENAELREQLASTEQALVRLRHELNLVHQSRSWRLTSWLRKGANLLR